MKPLRLVCFGPPAVLLDGHAPAPDVVWRKHLALLAYLSLSPDRTRTRTHLVGLLWPEKTSDAARHSLNEAVRRLRADIGTERLVSEGELVRLASEGLDVDACRFEEAAADCEAAARLLRGDFLEGLALDDAPPFEEWLSLQRARFRSRGAEVLVACGERRLAASRFAEAQDAGLRALNLEPFAEPPVRLLMRAAALSGDVAGALAHFRDHEATLAAQLREAPSRELSALRDRIRQQRSAFSAPGPQEQDPPLVGRAAATQAAFALVLEGTVRGPRVLVVSGDPGMGRSRLLAECERRLSLEGAVVARARPIESDEDVPWSTLGQLLRDGLLRAPGMAAADPDGLGVLASIEPSLAERAAPRQPRDAAHVAEALASLLAAVADEQPVALLVDDGHFADPRTLEALDAALTRLSDAPVTLVVAVDATAVASSREMLRLRGHVGAGLPGLSVRLDPLDAVAVGELVAAMADWCEGERRDRLARRIAVESGGSPFLAVTLLRALRRESAIREALTAWPPADRTLTAPLPISVPHLVRSAVLLQLAQVTESARKLLEAWSVAGPVWDPDLVMALSGLAPGDVEEGLAALERQRFVDLAGDRYVFVSPLVPEVVRTECLTRGRVRALRAVAIAHLAAREDLESRVLRAELLAANEPGPSAFEAALAVARDALAAGSRRRAARAVAAARRALGHEAPEPDSLRALDAQLAR